MGVINSKSCKNVTQSRPEDGAAPETCALKGYSSIECVNAVASAYGAAHAGARPPWCPECKKCTNSQTCPKCETCEKCDECEKCEECKECNCQKCQPCNCKKCEPCNCPDCCDTCTNCTLCPGCAKCKKPPTPPPFKPKCKTSTQADFKDLIAKANALRCRYGAQPLTWDETLVPIAKNSATYNVENYKISGFKHIEEEGHPHGENLYWNSSAQCNTRGFATSAEELWESEEAQYIGREPGYYNDTGHFTQIVWKGTNRIGCSAVTGSSEQGTVVSCVYGPAGNNRDTFASNVGSQNPNAVCK